MRSKLKIIGTRTCETCGASVNIIKTERNGDEVEVSECLNCEKKVAERQAAELYKRREANKASHIFDKYSMITEDLIHASFESYIPDDPTKEEALKKSTWYANNFSDDIYSLLFQSSYGLGKSHLAYSIAKQIQNKGLKVIFINSPALLNAIRDSYNNANFSESEILNIVHEVDLLVLDDIGAEYIKQEANESWAVDKLFQIVNSRIGKPTIYTTNCSSKELSNKYGAHGGRIVSRMMQGTKIIKMSGSDYRMKGL